MMANLQAQLPESAPAPTTAHYIPFAESSHFWGRQDILAAIDENLLPGSAIKSIRSFALYGMGGVGKTQIALRYANASRDKFDAIFWISAEDPIKIGQSFRDMARMLSLVKADAETDDNAITLEVKQWLSSTSGLCQHVSHNSIDWAMT